MAPARFRRRQRTPSTRISDQEQNKGDVDRLRTIQRSRYVHPVQFLHFVRAAVQIFEFSAILIGQCTPIITSIVCEYSGSGIVVSKRAMEQRSRSIEPNSIIRVESKFGRLILGRSISSGQRGQKWPIAKDWMLQSALVETRGLGFCAGVRLGNVIHFST